MLMMMMMTEQMLEHTMLMVMTVHVDNLPSNFHRITRPNRST
jgi:hypothetical protein